jgi:predicted DNA-binding protein YlxM (UPF0122 family)
VTIDDRLKLCALFDNYGALLTERQREVFNLHYNDDLSFGEISERLCISRPAVVDHLRRAEIFLRDIEVKLGHTEKLRSVEMNVNESLALMRKLKELSVDVGNPSWTKLIDDAIAVLLDISVQ